MEEILLIDKLSPKASQKLGSEYHLSPTATDYRAIILRSSNIHSFAFPDSLLCVGRSGAGTNNIPVAELAEKGVVVFNAPGANANAVKELVLTSLFISSRNIIAANSWVNTLRDGELAVAKQVEKGKSAFAGTEILGKTLCVYGLGAIGKKVALSAKALGMNVIGYDPYLTEEAKQELNGITIATDKQALFKYADYLTLHVPLTSETKNFISEQSIATMKDGVKLINLARGELVDSEAIINATQSGKVSCYVTDFATEELLNKKNIIVLPHLGASTVEAEDNCAVVTCNEIVDYLENGNIKNSVNYPNISSQKGNHRLVVLFKNEETEVKISKLIFGKLALTTSALKKDFGVLLIDTDEKLDENTIENIKATEGVLKLRYIH